MGSELLIKLTETLAVDLGSTESFRVGQLNQREIRVVETKVFCAKLGLG